MFVLRPFARPHFPAGPPADQFVQCPRSNLQSCHNGLDERRQKVISNFRPADAKMVSDSSASTTHFFTHVFRKIPVSIETKAGRAYAHVCEGVDGRKTLQVKPAHDTTSAVIAVCLRPWGGVPQFSATRAKDGVNSATS
jgi:hypothetical protein